MDYPGSSVVRGSNWLPDRPVVADLCWVADRHEVEAGASCTIIRYQESSLNKKQLQGRIDQTLGRVKQLIGKAVGNKELEQDGTKQEAGGKIRSGHGDRKEQIEDSI